MIIARAPLRVSIAGGGTDLPSYYTRFGSTFISAAINKYVYISIHKNFHNEYFLRYSQTERVKQISEIKHPILREALRMVGEPTALEISSFADIPAGTGLGSSGTFTVGLLKALMTSQKIPHTPAALAEMACEIEMEKLGAPIGKQDQYISAFGGLTKFSIDNSGVVAAQQLQMQPHDLVDLEEHLLLLFTGYSRSANEILGEQVMKSTNVDHELNREMIDNLHFVAELGSQIEKSLIDGKLSEFGRLMDIHWQNKKKRSGRMSNSQIDEWYQLAMKNGALGGKLIGAGGGGFLMFFVDDKRRVRRVLREAGMQDVPFQFDYLGAQTLLREEN